MPTEDLFILLFCTIDDWLRAHPLPPRPGPRPACSDAEILTFAIARDLLDGGSERRFLRQLRRNWRHLFPRLPAQSELNRRSRWLFGAVEGLRQHLLRQLRSATSSLVGIDTSPLPVTHPTRADRSRGWHSVWGELQASWGYCAAKKQWFYGFRLGVVAALSDAVPQVWALPPAAVDERQVAHEMLRGRTGAFVVADRGFDGAALRAYAQRQGCLLYTPARHLRRAQPTPLMQEFVRRRRNQCEQPFAVLQQRFHLLDHGAKTVWGLATRIAGKVTAFTLRTLWREQGYEVD